MNGFSRESQSLIIIKPWPFRSREKTLGGSLQRAPGEIDFFLALGADVCLVKFVGENLLFLAAFRAFAQERTQIFVFFKPGTMCRCCHHYLPFGAAHEGPDVHHYPHPSEAVRRHKAT